MYFKLLQVFYRIKIKINVIRQIYIVYIIIHIVFFILLSHALISKRIYYITSIFYNLLNIDPT